MGELGYRPYEFWCLMPCDLDCIMTGYNNKLIREAKLLRRVSFFTVVPHAQKDFTEEKFNNMWKIGGDENVDQEKKKEIPRLRNWKEILQQQQKNISAGMRQKNPEKVINGFSRT